MAQFGFGRKGNEEEPGGSAGADTEVDAPGSQEAAEPTQVETPRPDSAATQVDSSPTQADSSPTQADSSRTQVDAPAGSRDDKPAPVHESSSDFAEPAHALPGRGQSEHAESVEPLSDQSHDEEPESLSRDVEPPWKDNDSDADRNRETVASGGDDSRADRERETVASGRDDSRADRERETVASQQEEHGAESASRVSVVDEQPPRPEPPDGASEEDYKWHTYKVYPSGRPDAVEFVDVYKAFGRNRILRGVNMGLPEGMVSMIIGPSGTGKSVCIKHMVGLLYPDEGDVVVHGESVPNMPDDQLFDMRKKFGLLFQDGALFGSMNIFDNVAFPLRQHTEKGEDEVEEVVMHRLNEVGLGNARTLLPNELSGGMRKRAGFARALVLEPDILLFDEPDSGLDPVRTALLGELILEIHRDMMDEAKKKKKAHLPTFCVITHDIMSARRVADYINVLWKGRVVEAGPAEDMLNSENPFIRQFLSGESQGPLTMD